MRFRTSSLPSSVTWLLGLLLVAGAFFGVVAVGRYNNRQIQVVVATRDLPPLSPIMPGDVAVASKPLAALPRSGWFRATAPLVGKFVGYGLVKGEVVQGDMLASAPGVASVYDVQLSHAVDSTKTDLRAVPFPLNESSGFTLPRPGDHVDIVAVLSSQGQGTAGQATKQARVLIPQALVLSVSGPTAAGPTSQGSFAGSSTGATQTATSGVLILALTQSQAEQLVLAESMGTLTLLLDPMPTQVAAQGSATGPAGPTPPGASRVTVAPPVTDLELTGGALPYQAAAVPAPAIAGTLPPTGGA